MTIERVAYRPNEVADALGVSRSRVYAWIADGSIRTTLVGSRIRIPAAELARIGEEGVPATGERPGTIRSLEGASAR
jgi:excisionase family DNA binding protein